jgi:hypothetical protein
LNNGSLVSGTVTAIKNQDSTRYEVEYVVNGNIYTVQTMTDQPKKNIGDKVEVRYSNPNDSVINTFAERYSSLFAWLVFTVIFFCSGLLVIRFKKFVLKQDGTMYTS